MRGKWTLLSAVFMNIVFMISFSDAYENEINRMSDEMAQAIADKGKKRIAVVDFTDLQGNVTELGRFIAEEFSVTLLGKSDQFQIVDRTHLKSLIKEHKLSQTGLIDPKTARKLGEIAGVDALITGTITPFGENIRISAKVLDVSTAMLIAAKNGKIAATEGIKSLMASGIVGRDQPVPTHGATGKTDNFSRQGNPTFATFGGTNIEGWKIENAKTINPGNGGSGGGAGNGCLVFRDENSGVSYFVASSKFHGNWRSYSKLKFDLWCSGGTFYNKSEGVEYYDVILKSGFATAYYRFPEKPTKTWKTYSIPLDSDDGWKFVEGATTLSDVLVNVTEFKIRAEYGVGKDKSGLDNVRLVR